MRCGDASVVCRVSCDGVMVCDRLLCAAQKVFKVSNSIQLLSSDQFVVLTRSNTKRVGVVCRRIDQSINQSIKMAAHNTINSPRAGAANKKRTSRVSRLSAAVFGLLAFAAAFGTVASAAEYVTPPECVCSNPIRIAPTLGGQTLTAGCYLPVGDAAWGITGQLQLSGSGRFVFNNVAALNTDTASVVSLIGGANCADVHWCSTAAATLGSSSVFAGSIATGPYAAITVGADAQVSGVLTPGNNVLVAGARSAISPCGNQLSSTPGMCVSDSTRRDATRA